jgi:FecR protein/Putative zinc-finger
MFSKHVTKDISAYCHGELSSEDSKRFAEHIIACAKCRTKFEEIKLGVKLAEQLPHLSAGDQLWYELEPLLEKQSKTVVEDGRLRKTGFGSWRVQAAAAAAVLLLAAGGWWLYHSYLSSGPLGYPPIVERPAWLVTRVDGMPKIGSEGISSTGELGIGDWLETDAGSRAQIEVGSIGNVDVDENSRLRLLATQPTEHRLELLRGKMSARIWAPPRLFFVNTPSAVAADLGCAYTLEVDDHGGSKLRVTAGWVELQLKDRQSKVPAGAACETQPGVGPGTPYFEDASPAFREALKKVDFNDDAISRKAALASLLSQARERDTLTLWHLLPRLAGEERVLVFEKIAVFFPAIVKDRVAILMLDEKFLEAWRLELEPLWGTSSKIGTKGANVDYWKLKKGLSPKMKNLTPK